MRWELNNYPILRYRIDGEKCFPLGHLTVPSRSPRFPGHEVSAKLRQYKRIVPGQERIGALGTNSLIQIHERPSVYPPLERSAIKTDSSMDDGGIRPAVNQTTKFLASARKCRTWTVPYSRLHFPLSLSLSSSFDAQGCNYASMGPNQSREKTYRRRNICTRVKSSSSFQTTRPVLFPFAQHVACIVNQRKTKDSVDDKTRSS